MVTYKWKTYAPIHNLFPSYNGIWTITPETWGRFSLLLLTFLIYCNIHIITIFIRKYLKTERHSILNQIVVQFLWIFAAIFNCYKRKQCLILVDTNPYHIHIYTSLAGVFLALATYGSAINALYFLCMSSAFSAEFYNRCFRIITLLHVCLSGSAYIRIMIYHRTRV
jgi:hypothetical protein